MTTINLTAMGQLRNGNEILKVSDLGIHEYGSNMDINGIVCEDMDLTFKNRASCI
jgi:hypothetical protein